MTSTPGQMPRRALLLSSELLCRQGTEVPDYGLLPAKPHADVGVNPNHRSRSILQEALAGERLACDSSRVKCAKCRANRSVTRSPRRPVSLARYWPSSLVAPELPVTGQRGSTYVIITADSSRAYPAPTISLLPARESIPLRRKV